MPVSISQLKFYKSTPSTGSGQNRGGAISAVEIDKNINPASPIWNQIFRDFTNTERNNGSTQYKCIFLKNTHATLTVTNGQIWFSAVTPNPSTYTRMGLETNAISTPAHTIANETTAPSGIDLDTRHNAPGESITLPSIPAGGYVGIWFMIELRPNAAYYAKDWFEVGINITTPA